MSATVTADSAALDVEALRRDFPSLDQQIHGKPLAYLDNAASAQTPLQVIDAIRNHYLGDRSNVHRGIHELSQRATDAYEKARVKVQRFLNAAGYEEIIWTRGTTEGINLVASSWGRANVREGDEILISALEHHSNIVPWQMLCEQTGAKLRVIPMDQAGELLQDEYEKLLNERTRLVAVNHVSNALGTVNPVTEMIRKAHAAGALVLIDGAQAIPHMAVNVRALDADFYAFSGHKVFGPTGIGALYGKRDLLDAMPPYQGGGDMIASVTFEKTVYNDLPYKFEAGTPNIADAIGLGAAVDYVQGIGMDTIAAYEAELLAVRHRESRLDRRRAADRDGERQGVGPVLRARGSPPARRGHHPGPRRRGRPRRTPLRPACDGLLRGRGDQPRFVRVLQHASRRSISSSQRSAR